jgi:hypothetical protein
MEPRAFGLAAQAFCFWLNLFGTQTIFVFGARAFGLAAEVFLFLGQCFCVWRWDDLSPRCRRVNFCFNFYIIL